jgi:hypothetical protein
MGGHFAVFVSVIITKIIKDLPASEYISLRLRHQTKDGRNAF